MCRCAHGVLKGMSCSWESSADEELAFVEPWLWMQSIGYENDRRDKMKSSRQEFVEIVRSIKIQKGSHKGPEYMRSCMSKCMDERNTEGLRRIIYSLI